jgi:GTP-binding protein
MLINLLIDSRRGIKENDITVMDMIMQHEIPMQIICTKADEIKTHQALEVEIKNFVKLRYGKDVNIIFTSVRTKQGANELQKSIMECL